MQTKYNIGDVVYVSDIDNLEIYTKKIHERTVNEEILYKAPYGCYKERRCHSTFEEARTYLLKYISAQYQEKLNLVLTLKDAEKAN